MDECSSLIHSCSNDSVCVNLPGGYDCVCSSPGRNCSGDCLQQREEGAGSEEEEGAGLRRNGSDWTHASDPCTICSCKVGLGSNRFNRF